MEGMCEQRIGSDLLQTQGALVSALCFVIDVIIKVQVSYARLCSVLQP